MMNISTMLIYIAVMAVVTYIVRMLPLVFMKKKIENKFIKSFLYYVPYAVLAAMTFPAILYATSSVISAVVGLVIALILAYFERSLIIVSLFSCVGVLLTEVLLQQIR